jgi:hypothetical protein
MGGGGAAHSVLTRRSMQNVLWKQFDAIVAEQARRAWDQRQHVLQLWPRIWEGGRPLTQVEQIVDGVGDVMLPHLDPFEQQAQMAADAEKILDSYKPKGGENAGNGPANPEM